MDESLSFIDRDIDDASVYQYVLELIEQEKVAMKQEGFGVDDIGVDQYLTTRLSQLGPYPELKFSKSPMLQVVTSFFFFFLHQIDIRFLVHSVFLIHSTGGVQRSTVRPNASSRYK